MLRPRARRPARGRGPWSASLLPLLIVLALAASGCGDDEETAGSKDEPSRATAECREEWKDVAGEVEGRSSAGNPSALAPRWNNIAATADYYASAATDDDCGATLTQQTEAMDVLTAFSTRLVPYDMELRLEKVRDAAEAYSTGPRPPAPSPSPTKKGKKAKPAPRPPKPADVATALRTLTQQAPLATRQQGPGWQQAHVVDLADAAATTKAVKDLAFLSSESAAYRACTAALAQIDAALAAAP